MALTARAQHRTWTPAQSGPNHTGPLLLASSTRLLHVPTVKLGPRTQFTQMQSLPPSAAPHWLGGPLTWPVLSLFRSGDGTSPDGGFPRRVLQRAASPREADTVSSNIFNCPVKLTIIEPIIEETIPDTLPELSIN